MHATIAAIRAVQSPHTSVNHVDSVFYAHVYAMELRPRKRQRGSHAQRGGTQLHGNTGSSSSRNSLLSAGDDAYPEQPTDVELGIEVIFQKLSRSAGQTLGLLTPKTFHLL